MLGVQETERSRLELEAERGRRWAEALEVWLEFIARKREEGIGVLERPVGGDASVLDLLAELRVLRAFEDIARTSAESGKIAERKLNDG